MLKKAPTRLQQFVRSTAVSVASFAAMLGIGQSGAAVPAAAREPDYRPATTVPPAWNRFGHLVQSRFQQALAGDGEAAYRLHAFLEKRAASSETPQDSLIVKTWIGADGRVERVTFPALGDRQADEDLQAVLLRRNIGVAPPRGMLQPLHLRLSLAFAS